MLAVKVNRSGLEEDVVTAEDEEEEEGEGAEEKGVEKSWLVHITLESGHGLAVRDRTGRAWCGTAREQRLYHLASKTVLK